MLYIFQQFFKNTIKILNTIKYKLNFAVSLKICDFLMGKKFDMS